MNRITAKPYICRESEDTFVALAIDTIREFNLEHNIGSNSRMDGSFVYIAETPEWFGSVLPSLNSQKAFLRFTRPIFVEKHDFEKATTPYNVDAIVYPSIVDGGVAGSGYVTEIFDKTDRELGHLAKNGPIAAVSTNGEISYVAASHLPVYDAKKRAELEVGPNNDTPSPPRPSM